MRQDYVIHICVIVLLTIIPAIGFAHGQSLSGMKMIKSDWVEKIADTIPGPVNRGEPQPEPEKKPLVKRVPKSRRQPRPVSLPEAPVRPVIKPKIIKPVVKVAL